MKTNMYFFGLLAFIGLSSAKAQLGIGTTSPSTTLQVDGVNQATTGVLASGDGVTVPRTTTDMTASPVAGSQKGQLVYSTHTNSEGFYNWDGSQWQAIVALGTGSNPAGNAGVGSSYGTVVSSTGKVWLDRNLGASRVATSSVDAASYGDYYQWGRAADGHEKSTSATSSTQATSWIADEGSNPWDGKFINNSSGDDWLMTPKNDLWSGTSAENNPCPSGFRIPTNAEFNQERLTWESNDSAGAFASPLKLPLAGFRDDSSLTINSLGTLGTYWSSTASGNLARRIGFDITVAVMGDVSRSSGRSVRCVKD